MTTPVIPFALKNAPALIERLLPVQKLSAEAYKEQMANIGKTLTALGNYWKGRKPLILNKACILGCLLPATDDPARDLEIFEKLMAMDNESFAVRWKRSSRPKQILAKLAISQITDYFTIEPDGILPLLAPIDWLEPEYDRVKVNWRSDIDPLDRRRLEVQMLPNLAYRERVEQAKRPEEVMDTVHDHIWDAVNIHLNTNASSIPELVEQLGVMRFGHRPRLGDTFCGSGQIPFEAARLGCDVFASDLNPIACLLTWGAFNIVGGSTASREQLAADQKALVEKVQEEIDRLDIESDGKGWRGRAYLYCLEVRCPSTGWMVPLLPSLVVGVDDRAIMELSPDPVNKRYELILQKGVTPTKLRGAALGTLRNDGRGQEPYLLHTVNGTEYRTKISTLRGDYRQDNGATGNQLRLWEKEDFAPRPDDIFQERLYCIQWMRPKKKGRGFDFEFRAVTKGDLEREQRINDHLAEHFPSWQNEGWLPDMRIERGGETERLYRERGWTHWHHLFNPRQILVNALFNRYAPALLKPLIAQAIQYNARLCMWHSAGGGRAGVQNVFSNQALNTLYQYGSRATSALEPLVRKNFKWYPLPNNSSFAQILYVH